MFAVEANSAMTAIEESRFDSACLGSILIPSSVTILRKSGFGRAMTEFLEFEPDLQLL
jgi:hypothetical protein